MSNRSLSLVVPAFNEERRLPTLFAALPEARSVAARLNLTLAGVIVVDDGSSDGTAQLAGLAPGVELLRLERNRGKGAAVAAGVGAARGDLILVSDVDLSTPFRELPALVSALDRGFRVAIGSRAIDRSRVEVHQPLYRQSMGQVFNLMIRALTRLPFGDTQCGFKLFEAEAARSLFRDLRTDGFAYDVEVLLRARRRSFAVVEVPVAWSNDPDTTVDIVRSSARMAFDLIRIVVHERRATKR
jgi:dolichyl-phosphate beta-glucosyltransferase